VRQTAVLAEVLIFAVTGICLTVKDAAAWKAIQQKANALAASVDADMKRLAEEVCFATPMPTSIDGEIAAQVDALAAGANLEGVKKILTLLERRKAFAKANK
jgi:hypothetical protein